MGGAVYAFWAAFVLALAGVAFHAWYGGHRASGRAVIELTLLALVFAAIALIYALKH
jgi:hypothetical protein